MRALALAALAALVTGPALADQLHDIPWYQAHPAARTATQNLCRSDTRFRHDADCLNADVAADRSYAEERAATAKRGLDRTLTSPTYYAQNRLERIATLAACRHGSARPETCAAATAGEAMAQGGR